MVQYPTPPPPGIRRVFWTLRIKFEGMTALAMLEPWERAMCYSVLLTLIFLFWWSFYRYAPGHIQYLSRRFSYYVWDDETVDAGEVLKKWLWGQLSRVKAVKDFGGLTTMGKKVEL